MWSKDRYRTTTNFLRDLFTDLAVYVGFAIMTLFIAFLVLLTLSSLFSPLHAQGLRSFTDLLDPRDNPIMEQGQVVRGENYVELTRTRIEIGPPQEANAVATVTMNNLSFNSVKDNRTEKIKYEGIEVTVTFRWDKYGTKDDAIEVVAPEGYVAVPPEITVPEGKSGQVHIYPYSGMSM